MAGYLFTRIFIESFRLVPFWLLYFFSDISRILIFNIFGYRKKVVFDNLRKAFPEKSEDEIKSIAKKFYKNFTDVLFEGIKGLTMSNKSAYKRFIVVNPEIINEYYDQGRTILTLGCHYANWEWGVTTDWQYKHKSMCVYKTLSNKRLNDYMAKRRARWNMPQIPMERTRMIFRNLEVPKLAVLIADQNPSKTSKAIWVDFLGRDTPCIHGPEIYGKLYNFPAFFMDFQRVKRGHYTLELSLLHDNPKSLEKGELTKIYMNKLEKVIRKKPEDWMWTHKRWKHKRENGKILDSYYYKNL